MIPPTPHPPHAHPSDAFSALALKRFVATVIVECEAKHEGG